MKIECALRNVVGSYECWNRHVESRAEEAAYQNLVCVKYRDGRNKLAEGNW